jgi:zinc transport system permease protein
MTDAFAFAFMQRALAAGVLVGLLASYYGVFVVQRGLSFLGSGLAHSAFGGVALGLLLGWAPLWVAVPFTVTAALGMSWVQARTALGADTAVGVVFSVAFALGVVFLSLRREYSADAFTYLFGSILAVTSADLWLTGAVALAALAASPLWGRWAYATFDRELALADRLPVERDDYVLSVLIAVTVVVAVKVVGIMLISAFLVIPAATARLLVRTFHTMTLVSAAVGTTSAMVGLWASYRFDIPSGATIILVQASAFAVAMGVRALRGG